MCKHVSFRVPLGKESELQSRDVCAETGLRSAMQLDRQIMGVLLIGELESAQETA